MTTENWKPKSGEFARTRDGRKATIYATDGIGAYPVHGAIDGLLCSWLYNGRLYSGRYDDWRKDDNLDLVWSMGRTRQSQRVDRELE